MPRDFSSNSNIIQSLTITHHFSSNLKKSAVRRAVQIHEVLVSNEIHFLLFWQRNFCLIPVWGEGSFKKAHFLLSANLQLPGKDSQLFHQTVLKKVRSSRLWAQKQKRLSLRNATLKPQNMSNMPFIPFWVPWVIRTGPFRGKKSISRQFAEFGAVFTLDPLNLSADTNKTSIRTC